MNISLPETLKEWVDRQIDEGGFGTASEYIRQLLREEQRRQVEAKLAEAEQRGEPQPVTTRTWAESEQRVAERLQAARKRRSHGKKNH